jgi:hypothetical protein
MNARPLCGRCGDREAERGIICDECRSAAPSSVWERLEAQRPPLPFETCPLVDQLSTLADAISADVGTVREGLIRSRSSIAREAGDELLDTEANLASLRLQLEDLRTANGQLRASVQYWRRAARELAK